MAGLLNFGNPQQGGGLLGLSNNDLLSLGAGLLSGTDWASGAGAGLQAVQQSRRQQAMDQVAQQQNALRQQQVDVNRGNLELQRQRLSQPKFSNTPIYGVDAQGNTIIGQVNNQGEFQQTKMPQGFTPTRPMQYLNTGTEFVAQPKNLPTGPSAASIPQQQAPSVPIDVAGEVSQKEQAKLEVGRKADRPKAVQRLNLVKNNMTRLRNAAATLKNHPGLARATGLWSMVPSIPGSDASNAEAKLRTLKAQIGFNALQEMREASKTGGALGQVAVQELEALQNSIDSLETAQSLEEFQRALDNIVANSERSLANMQQGFDAEFNGGSAPQQAAPPQQGGITGRSTSGLNYRLFSQ